MSNILNLSQMLTMVRYKLAEPTNTLSTWDATTGDAFLKQMINQACAEFNTAFPWPWMEAEHQFTTVKTTVSSSSTGTTLNVTSASGWGVGDYGWAYESTTYERFQVTNVATGVLTLAGSGLTNTFTTDGVVVRESYLMPEDFDYMFSVRDITNSKFIKPRNPHKVDYDIPVYSSASTPENYLLFGLDREKEPATSTNTADATTSTTTIVDSVLKALSDDYYKDWLLVNTTRTDQARVLSYTASTKTLTLKKAITSQASGDTYYLIRNLRKLYFSKLVSAATVLRCKYFRFPSLLIADSDVPESPPMFSHAIVNGAVGYALMQDSDEQRGTFYVKLMEKDMQRAWGMYGNRRYGMDEIYSIQNTSNSDYATSDDSD